MPFKQYQDIDDALFQCVKDSKFLEKFRNLGYNAWVIGNAKKYLKVAFAEGSHHGYYKFISVEIYTKGTRSDRYTFALHPNRDRHYHEDTKTFGGNGVNYRESWHPTLGSRVDELIEFHGILS